jgi:predicted NAD/FAD-dependent oxidoreductase
MWAWNSLISTFFTLQMPSRKSSVAIVGGGITGSCAASVLAKHFDNVVVFDQGRRGPGGRASHRSVNKNDGTVLQDDNIQDHPIHDTLQFDHGCQFFRADTKEMSEHLLPDWISKGFVAPWEARLGCLNEAETKESNGFFGVPARDENVYIGVGGMHLLPRRILEDAAVTVHRGTRVTSVRKTEGKWELRGTSGNAAYHDTKESEAQKVSDQVLAQADVVIFTDISSASDDWHRASAGIPDSLRKQIPEKVRLPLFSCMVALSHPIADVVPFDGFTVGGKSDLWFAARSQSKPGIPQGGSECWTLISTPSFAVTQIKETNMRDPVTGAFRPQENNYLNSIPGPALFDAFLEAVKPHLSDKDIPQPIYLQAQRWGSGLPVPDFLVDEAHDIVGTKYCSKLKSSLVYLPPDEIEGGPRDYIVDDELNLYYAGDFCSHRNPGFESSALSGVNVARHVVESGLE